ncbi:hypothetical protein KUTeg_007088 [Tegillarca granosa]|uniref:C3H1-type domain-containing protein n=1 Tax=Tegillarca granosa TaxID=220873 RepID=A0ABQ9FGW5_TEGGR|nr:hypothetical protein KUTeg_007088 [Tegillarca granosa]
MQTYITSLIGDGKEFTKFILKFPMNQFSMILEKKDSIEKTSQAVLDFWNESCQVCIHGKEENIGIAQALIEKMVQEQINNSTYEKTRSSDFIILSDDSDENNVEIQNFQSNCCESAKLEEDKGQLLNICDDYSLHTDCCDLESNLNIDMLNNEEILIKRGCDKGSPCRTPVTAELTHDTDGEKDSTDTSLELGPSLSELQLSSQVDRNITDNSELDISHTDSDFSSKVEFALKLGYTEEQLMSVLKKIGADAGQNAILSELIKIGTSYQPVDSCSDSCSDDFVLDHNTKTNSAGGAESSTDSTDFNFESSEEKFLEDTDVVEKSATSDNLRPIVIDGSNVAMSHGNKEVFSCHGIKLAVDWFRQRGHTDITVFVPQWRKETSRPDSKIKDQEILSALEREKVLVFTPARRIGGKRVVCYDDRYVLKLATETGGIVVSNDNYRDLQNENSDYKKVVEERLLMYSFVNDRFMPPDDPLGRHGPNLDNFLCKEPKQPEALPPLCPYGSKKCTYGNKCKYYHPERGNMPHKSVSEKLAEQAKQKLQEVRERGTKSAEGEKKKLELKRSVGRKTALQRTQSLVPVGSLLDQGKSDQSSINRHSGDFGALCLDNSELQKLEQKEQNPEKLKKWKNYDDKLTEYRKKVEKAEEEEKQRQEEIRKKEERVCSPAFGGLLDPGSPSKSNDEVRSRSSSPLQRGSPTPQIKPQEQFLSGHLLLAKKLSDEANDTKVRHRALEERELAESPLVCSSQQQQQQQFQEHLPLHRPLQHSQSHQQQHSQEYLPTHRPLQHSQSHHQPRHQTLSRQYSLQGAHDPRLRPGMQNLSYESQPISQHPHLYQQQQLQQQFLHQQQQYTKKPLLARARAVQGSHHGGIMRQDTGMVHGVRFSIGEQKSRNIPHPDLQRFHDNSCNDSVFYSGDEQSFVPEHAALSRMQSAPETIELRNQNSHRTIGRMVRQNSSSDTQLHMIGNELDTTGYNYGQVPVNVPNKVQGTECMPQYNSPSPSLYDIQQQQQHQQMLRSLSMGPQFSYKQHNVPHHRVEQSSGVSWSFGDQSPEKVSCQIGGNNNQFVNSSPYVQTREHLPLQATCSDFSDNMFSQRTQQDIWQNPHAVQGMSMPQKPPISNQGFDPQGIRESPSTSMYKQNLSDDSPIHPTDKRYNLYYHLCGLFPEVKVREVMNKYPEETNPQELCAYIIVMLQFKKFFMCYLLRKFSMLGKYIVKLMENDHNGYTNRILK